MQPGEPLLGEQGKHIVTRYGVFQNNDDDDDNYNKKKSTF